jgi:DNA-binding winged helix-turn-helix (wHTH) protein/dipeptidyl aminopeptidase/acylaminoacyl peptidase
MGTGHGEKLIYEFGAFRLDPAERLFQRERHVVPLTPKAFDLLVCLVERHGHLVEKQWLMSALWPDTIVEEANLAFQISALRKVLDEGGKGESVIQTVPTKGYRFVAAVTVAPAIARPVQAPIPRGWWRWRVLWVGCAIALVVGALMLIERSRHGSGGAAAPAADISPNQLHMRKLTDNDQVSDVAISPDARYVAFVRDVQSQSLWLRQIDTRTEMEILPTEGVGLSGLRFSPDGSLLYFIKSHPDDPFAGSLYSMSILGGAARLLIDDIKSPISFSPDGKRFVYKSCSSDGLQLRVARVDRDEQRLRVPMSGGPPREVGHNLSVGVHWPIGVSPDGTHLAYLQHLQSPGSSEGWNVAVVRTDDGSPVASWPVQLPRYHPRRFRWSPQGLAWQFLRSDGGGFNIWEQPIAGGSAKQLTRFTSGKIFNFYESLDGKRLVMTRGSLSHDVVLLTFK